MYLALYAFNLLYASCSHLILFLQVQRYVDPWPEAQWGGEDLSTICVMASSRSQVRCN